MPELWDVYDRNKKKIGKTVERGINALKEGEYHIAVAGIILNSKNEILITKRAAHKELRINVGTKWRFYSSRRN